MSKTAPKILVYHREADKYVKFLQDHGYTTIQAASTKEEALMSLKETEVILGWRFPTELLALPEASSVRWIQSTGAGIDDLVTDSNIPEDITITRILDQFGGLISEYVFSFLLFITKQLPKMLQAQEQRRWDPFKVDTLKGKVIGVAGLGSIGSEIIRKARAFDMTVYGLSFSGSNADLVDQHFTAGDWIDFVREIDYLVLTLPLTPGTYHIVNKEIMRAMKPGASIVNVGRGQLISEEDIVEVMKDGLLHAAVLDVFENEPLEANHPLWSMPNVYVTPHLSGQSQFEDVARFFIDNLRLFEQDKQLIGTVNRQKGY
ncbi:D-2-hydroxyacid dehydrogenase [Paenibacillus sp. RC67]|uniref:D-2-hydroxyacid dehydrogenase n=1 Tax=Paenibacillus sp. RC67 TaxID=3039392 RepID=UPI0024AE87ED|nr:D-2-hydroxyacid dehydrogenase [Paenibacillus sp. RC67]